MSLIVQLFRYCRLGVRIVGFVLITICCLTALELEALLRGKSARIRVINRWVPLWAGLNLWLYGVKVHSRGAYASEGLLFPSQSDNGTGRIFVANHRSGMDIPVLFTTAEAHVISRHDLAKWPLIGRGASRVGTLFVDRESRRSGASVLKQVDKALERGEGVAMFPEGGAISGEETKEFRSGAFNAARRAKAEIVPIGLAYDNDHAYYGDYDFMTHISRIGLLGRLNVAVEVGEPIPCGEMTGAELKEIAREKVQALMNRARAHLNETLRKKK